MDNQNPHNHNENEQYKLSEEQRAYEEEIRRRMKERRRRAEQKRVRRNRTGALILLIVIIIIIVKCCTAGGSSSNNDTSSLASTDSTVSVVKADTVTSKTDKSSSKADESSAPEHKLEVSDGMTFVDGILIVNKTYSLPSDYAPGISTVAQNAFDKMAAAAAQDGITLYVNSGYRSYQEQESLYNSYATERGTTAADEVSSRPGHSEHQTGLSFDVNTTEFSFEGTPEALWLDEHCAEYGFIIRFPKGKESITGYDYEPWHIRYLGEDNAAKVKESGLCLEEYLGVTSDYADATDCSY